MFLKKAVWERDILLERKVLKMPEDEFAKMFDGEYNPQQLENKVLEFWEGNQMPKIRKLRLERNIGLIQ